MHFIGIYFKTIEAVGQTTALQLFITSTLQQLGLHWRSLLSLKQNKNKFEISRLDQRSDQNETNRAATGPWFPGKSWNLIYNFPGLESPGKQGIFVEVLESPGKWPLSGFLFLIMFWLAGQFDWPIVLTLSAWLIWYKSSFSKNRLCLKLYFCYNFIKK